MNTKDSLLEKQDKAKRCIYKVVDRKFDKIDFAIILSLFGMCFFLFVQEDILVTGNRSFLMYRNLTDFYDACYRWTNTYGANYLPSTFWVFAIWNFPMYLAGYFPEARASYGIIIFWYKLLPIAIFVASSFLMKGIALKMAMGEKKAKLCQMVFFLSPIGFYSQFIFCQYDIFTVFFMLLGIYFYFDSKRNKYILFFGIAITFKYHALVFFMVLLVLAEKKISKIIYSIAFVLLPALIEVAMYAGSPYFMKSVFGFSSLNVMDAVFSWSGFGQINLCITVVFLTLVLAYMKSDIYKWSICVLNAINFAFFGCLSWHPQWLLIAMPFIVLGVMVSKYGKLMMLVEMIFSIALWGRIALLYGESLNIGLLKSGILKNYLINKDITTLTNQMYGIVDIKYLNSVILASFVAFFILSLPQNMLNDYGQVESGFNMYLRITFIVAITCFMLPILICMKDIAEGKFYFMDTSEQAEAEPIALTQNDKLLQKIYADGERIESIQIMIGNYGRINESRLFIEILDEDNESVYYGEKSCINMNKDNSWYNIVDGKVSVENGKKYFLSITTDALPGENVAIYAIKNYIGEENAVIIDDGVTTNENQIKIKVIGK